jgi:DNA-binding MarR family transcriptional regulator
MSKEINRLLTALEQFRSINPNMPVQQVQTFLYVCNHENDPEGCNVKDLAVALDYSLASASRNIAAFSELTRHKRAGPALLEATENFFNRAHKNISLTAKGRRLRQTLEELVQT